jgi:hypothetical protein
MSSRPGGRSLDAPPVFITQSYTQVPHPFVFSFISSSQVRRQGREGTQDAIKFPTLEVRNPNAVRRGPVQNKVEAASPVYRESTADIEEKLRVLNSAIVERFEAEEREQEVMEVLEEAAMAIQEEEEMEEEEAALAAEMDALTDLAAVEIVAEELGISALVDIKVDEVMAMIMAEEVVNEEIEAVSEAMERAVEENIVEVEEEDGPADAVDFGDITEKAM